jgi:hypothetical protein
MKVSKWRLPNLSPRVAGNSEENQERGKTLVEPSVFYLGNLLRCRNVSMRCHLTH